MRDDVAKAITVVEALGCNITTDEDAANIAHVLTVLRGIDGDPEPLEPPGGHWSRPPGDEVPWPPGRPDATLRWIAGWTPTDRWPDLGYLHWYDVNGDRAAIPVTHASDGQLPTTDDSEHVMNVWHVDELEAGVLQVSPSVHFIGYWHSPNPVQFQCVDALPDTAP